MADRGSPIFPDDIQIIASLYYGVTIIFSLMMGHGCMRGKMAVPFPLTWQDMNLFKKKRT
jgi:hypothetical protein